MRWTEDVWTYVNLGIPQHKDLWKYQESYTEKGLSDEAGFVALSLSLLYPREFPVKTLISWCGRSRSKLLKALKELEDAGWIQITAAKWKSMRNLVK